MTEFRQGGRLRPLAMRAAKLALKLELLRRGKDPAAADAVLAHADDLIQGAADEVPPEHPWRDFLLELIKVLLPILLSLIV